MASNEIVSEEAEEREFVTNPKNQYVAAGIVSGLASLSIGTTTTTKIQPELWSFKLKGYIFCIFIDSRKFRELFGVVVLHKFEEKI